MRSEDVTRLRESIRLLTKKLGLSDKIEASCCGITLSQCYALVEIGRAGNISVNDLANILGLDKSTASRTVDNLVKGGLAVRKEDESDRRYLKVILSDQGQQYFSEIEVRMGIYYKNVYEAISEEKIEQVLESIEILAEALESDSCC
jgi:DNA-binding MarR family transcriptional regulator